MRKNILIFLALAGCVAMCICAADVVASGNYTVNSDGYADYGDGYYWYGNYAHTRYWVPAYSSYGVYYPGRWQYVYHHTYTAVSPKDPNWRNKLLDIAAARDKAEAKLRLDATEQKYFIDAVKALGLEGNFHWDGYGQAIPYGGGYYSPRGNYGNLQLSTAGAQGSTVYSYSMNSIASFYGDPNLGQLYQQASRLAENAQKLAGQATSDFSGLIGQEGNNRARVAEILAKSQATQEYLRALQGSGGTVKTQVYSYKVVPGKDGAPQVEKVDVPPAADMAKAWEVHAAQKCALCHSPTSKKGGFDVTQYRAMSPEAKMNVLSRLVTSDAAKLMPRNKDGGPGPRLTADELKLWLAN